MSKPLDPALLRAVGSARSAVLTTAALVTAQAAVMVAGVLVLAPAVADLVTGAAVPSATAAAVGWFAASVAARAVLTAATEWRAHRGATRVIAELRERTVRHIARLGPRWSETHREEITTLTTRGLDALEPYLVRYLPQLLQTALVTPAILVVMAIHDRVSAVTIAAAIPLIVVFMWLIGVATQRTTARRLAAQQRLDARVLDLVAGLATLRALGRGRGTVAQVQRLADAERRGTMSTLRIAFLSGAALELLATLAVAAVAVGVGLRLVTGEVGLTTGLTVLILAPEALAAVRGVGAQFHASADGVAAVERCLSILDQAPPSHGTGDPGPVTEVVWDAVAVTGPGRAHLAPDGLTGQVRRGAVTVLHGPSGSGKTTALLALLGLVPLASGAVRLHGRSWFDLSDIDPQRWWRHVTWVPQRPVLEPGTVGEIVGTGDIQARAVAAEATGLADIVATLPRGWDTPIGSGGTGLSAGQRQRLALTRALTCPTPFLLLDEPTAHLDVASVRAVARLVRAAADRGTGVLVITHAEELLQVADHVVSTADAAVLS